MVRAPSYHFVGNVLVTLFMYGGELSKAIERAAHVPSNYLK